MISIMVAWGCSALLLTVLAAVLGARLTAAHSPLGILIDNRDRYSLTHLQLVVWSVVIISLITGVFFGRLVAGAGDPLGFAIPGQVLGLLGISVGSAVTAGAVKAAKNQTARDRLASQSNTGRAPFFGQVFLLEEGNYADQVVDVTKFQNFAFTIVLVVAYVAMAIHAIVVAKTAQNVTTLPVFGGTFLVLLSISYAGYVGGKMAPQTGAPARAQPAGAGG